MYENITLVFALLFFVSVPEILKEIRFEWGLICNNEDGNTNVITNYISSK